MNTAHAIRTLESSVGTASDLQIAQIVALIDAMPSRGAADELLRPHRARFAQLMLPRPVSFTRLLFMPLDSLIVPAAEWRRGGLAIPRTVLAPIADALRACMPGAAMDIDAEGRNGTIGSDRLTALAASIWPQAAIALDALQVPAVWTEATGLPEHDYAAIATIAAGGLASGLALRGLMLDEARPPSAAIGTILGGTAPRGGLVLSAVVAILLARCSGSSTILALATEASGANPSAAVDLAVDHILDTMQAALRADTAIGRSVDRARADIRTLLRSLGEIEPSCASRPGRLLRLNRLQREAGSQVATRCATALQDEFIARLETLPWNASNAMIEHLEATARGIRRLIAHAGPDERSLQLLLDDLHRPGGTLLSGKLRKEDRIRLVEILSGPDQAMLFAEQSRNPTIVEAA